MDNRKFILFFVNNYQSFFYDSTLPIRFPIKFFHFQFAKQKGNFYVIWITSVNVYEYCNWLGVRGHLDWNCVGVYAIWYAKWASNSVLFSRFTFQVRTLATPTPALRRSLSELSWPRACYSTLVWLGYIVWKICIEANGLWEMVKELRIQTTELRVCFSLKRVSWPFVCYPKGKFCSI